MAYYVCFDSLFTANCTAKTVSGEWITGLSDVADSCKTFIGDASFSGAAAANMKQYLAEVHGVIQASLQELLANYYCKISLYTDGYMNSIDTDKHAILPETDLELVRRRMEQLINSVETEKNRLRTSADNISDLVALYVPTASGVIDNLGEAASIAGELDESVLAYEGEHVNDFSEIDTIIACVGQLISNLLAVDRTALIHYQSGGIAALTDCIALRDALQVSMQYRADNLKALELANEHESIIIEDLIREAEEAAAKQRLEQGIWTAIAAVGAVVVGVVAIVATAGAATPAVVAGAFYVAGACSAAYGVSNLVQAGQDIYYGATGDPFTAAFNPLRDTIFMGNQSAYDTWGSLNMIVAGLAVPVNSAFNAASVANSTATMGSIGRVVATEMGKDAIAGVAGKYAGQAAAELTGSESFGTFVGVGTGILTSVVLGKVDEKLNISGLYDPSSVAAHEQAKKIISNAEDAEPEVTDMMHSLESDKSHLEGLPNRIKGEDSLTRKIYSDSFKEHAYVVSEAEDNIGDSLRYTLIVEDDSYSSVVDQSLKQMEESGYKVVKFKNTWDNDVYKGINVNIESPDGTTFELQFHTQDSFHTKQDLNHDYYEIARSPASTPEQIKRATDVMRGNTSKIPIPSGVAELNW